MADYATHIAGSPADAALLPHLKTDPEGKTYAEAQAFYQGQTEQFKAQAAKILAEHADDAAFQAGHQQVFNQVLDQLNTANRFAPDVNRAYASLVRDFYTTMAGRTDTTPGELLARKPVNVTVERLLNEADRYDQPAWHGSPHRGIEQHGFKMNAIGSGEGAQAYGWGMYFAGLREVAEGYRQAGRGAPTGRAEEIARERFPDADAADLGGLIAQAASQGISAKMQQNRNPEIRGLDTARLQEAIDTYRRENDGQLYRAHIPEDSELLAWDKPFSEQPKGVREKLRALLLSDRVPDTALEDFGVSSRAKLAADILRPEYEGSQINGTLEDVFGGPEKTSKALLAAGIPGLRYLDGNSRSDGKGTHNHVIWDEALLTPEAAKIEAYYQGDAERKPVASIVGDEIAPQESDTKTLRAAARDWYNANLRGIKVLNEGSGREIEFRGSRKTFRASADPDKLRLFAALPEVLQHGTLEDSIPPRDPGKEPNTRAWHWIAADVDIGGRRVRVGVTVREDNNGHLYYNHTAVKGEGPAEARSDPALKAGAGASAEPYKQSVASADDGVNLHVSGEQNNRGAYNPETGTIALLRNADLSTFLHESGHHFLELTADLASGPDAPPAIRADFEKLLDWFGVKGSPDISATEVWHNLSFEEKRSYHEQFARGFEKYLMEGEAPSTELQPLFSRFRAWLLNVYQSLSGLDVELTPEVRGVFDRMLASEEAC
ncbi:MAG: hypothetical protein JSR19_13690 [Proteobacteria bacterium]|nr:hypothetical protein [Pseudomonadota bacterium]HQR02737.1 hypothetical protein [Rhodocyclaceae bacterium]